MNGSVHVGNEDKQVIQHYYVTKLILMKVYNMKILGKVMLNFVHFIVYHTLVACYHAQCSNAYLACLQRRVEL